MPRRTPTGPIKTPPPLNWKRVYPEGATDLQPVLIDVFKNPSGVLATEKLSEAVANRFAANVKRIIANQAYGWVALSPRYKAYKQAKALDPRTLIATGRYIDSIKARKNPDGSWSVGVGEGPIRPGSKKTLKDLAHWLEFGTRTMPARPHWRPALAAFKAELHQVGAQYRKAVFEHVKRKIRRA